MIELYFPHAGVSLAWPWLLLIGLSVGVLVGFFGVGGGWLTTPSLNILGFPIVYAIGTGLAYVTGSAVVGASRHYRLGNLDPRLALVLGLSGMAGLEIARRLVFLLEGSGLAGTSVRLAYLLLLWGVGLSIVLEYARSRPGHAGSSPKAGADTEPSTRLSRRIQALRLPPTLYLASAPAGLSLWVLVAVGLGVGVVAGFLGAGGGFIIVPALVYLLGIATRAAVASSLASVVLTAGYGALSYGLAGRVEPLAAGIMFVGAALGSQFGAMATVYAPSQSLRLLLGITLLLAGVAVLLQELGLPLASMAVLFGTAFAMTAAILGFLVRGLRGRKG
ncbi:MAG: sulfite exporter TauE/SafE family protein [Chloroflexi bacterium]|nr:sulfite exporter TauE/SafE family protein [Chloroflexota bacterium]